jgi:signal recognition particle GTPase
MSRIKEYITALAIATICCWIIPALCLNYLEIAEALVFPLSKHHHYFVPISDASNNKKNKKTGDVTTTTSLFVVSQELHQKKENVDLERAEEDVDYSTEVSSPSHLDSMTFKLSPDVQVTWEPDAAKIIKQLVKISNPNRPFVVGVVGIPGSGKSTSCEILAAYMEDEVNAMVIPM